MTGSDCRFIALTPMGSPNANVAIAGSRAGATGVLNLEFADDETGALAELSRLVTQGRESVGVLLDGGAESLLSAILDASFEALDTIIFTGASPERLVSMVERVHASGRQAYLVVTDLEGAETGHTAGVDALIAKGHEAGGWVGEETSFVLLQHLIGRSRLPVWAYGGIGLHSAAAAYVAGAAGLVLDSQLLLARETPVSERVRGWLEAMDGSETVCLGAPFGAQFRAYAQPGLGPVEEARRLETSLTTENRPITAVRETWRGAIRERVDWQDPNSALLAIGQDACFASELARRFRTVGGIVAGLRESIDQHVSAARRSGSLAEGAPLARSHGTRYPIVQGPMTRVSDTAQFAAAVAEAGALPFLALALMRAPEIKALLEDTQRLLADRPWGVGVLGFVPAELRAEQLEVIRAYHPPFALIAGGRPDQARILEEEGIATYLHVPSPGLLSMYLKDGARRFVFEGWECGGHVGPRTSFVLWDTMVRVLLAELPAGANSEDFHVLFAGGIHDGLSAAMVAAITAPLVERGVRVGVLIGTAYLFTEEAVRCGAITSGFQTVAAACDHTELLESGPGHATRCAPSPYVDEFRGERRRLLLSELSPGELRNRLEELNIGRLRIASKGLDRDPAYGQDPTASKLVSLDSEEQWAGGMYMIGQVAALHDSVCTLADLHREVADGARRRLRPADSVVMVGESAPPPAAVAIVGIGSVLPGASDLRTFWANILNHVDAITEVPATRWDWRQYFDPERTARDKIYSRWGGFVDDSPFDPLEFGMPPNSIPSIERFQLFSLMVVRDALRDAGYLDRPFPRERTSVIFGAGGGGADLTAGYMVRSSLAHLFGERAADLADNLNGALPEWTEDSFAGLLMNVAAGRVANRFDFGGVNYTVDAACASSLAAVHLAVRDLEAHTSDVVVAGGVDAIQNPFAYLCFSKTHALSPNGRSRPFDAQADGIAISEGFVAVILKRLADAERDGDRIYAVIRGVGGASDGRDRSLTAPRPEGQMRALHRAYAQARVSPTTVGLVEAHGTGTVAGDQAEVQSLTAVFGEAGAVQQSCALGSVKSMIGHTKATAGVAGLTKVALALHHKVLPPTLGVSQPNPKANFPASPFYVNTETRPWINGSAEHPRRAGVSAFGFGGTNFHVVVEEYTGDYLPDRSVNLELWPAELFVWRGQSRAEIASEITQLSAKLEQGARPDLADLAYTVARVQERQPSTGRPVLALVATSIADLQEKLIAARTLLQGASSSQHAPNGIHYAEQPLAQDGRIAFLFPGQGSQSVNMARDLAVVFPEVRACFDRADRAMAHLDDEAAGFDQPLSRYIFPPPVFTEEDKKRHQAELTETHVAQPALGAAGLAYLTLIRSLGLEPDMVAGHSYGEFLALCAAGCFDEETLLKLSEARGRFIREGISGESGTMAAVDAAPEALSPLQSDPDLVLANLNAPEQTVISGTRASVERAIRWCETQGLRARLLPVACAFHSPLVAPAQRRLADRLRQTKVESPRLPVFSNSTAAPYPEDPTAIVDLLSEHLIRPVEFNRQIEAMHQAGARIFVEVGPRNVLTGLVDRILADRPHLSVALDQSGRPGLIQLLHALAALVAEGAPLVVERLFQGRSVRQLDLSVLEHETGEPRYSQTTWLINGGQARPAGRPAGEHLSSLPLPIRVGKDAEQPTNGGSAPSNGSNLGADRASVTLAGARPVAAVPVHDQSISAEPAQNAPNGVPSLPAEVSVAATTHAMAVKPIGGTMSPSDSVPHRTANADDVMGQFQQIMQHFLDTQRTVMLSYLGDSRISSQPVQTRQERPAATTQPALVAPDRVPALQTESPITPVELSPGGSPDARATALPLDAALTTAPSESSWVKTTPNGKSTNGPPIAPLEQPIERLETLANVPTREQLTEQLLAAVSERTGYPTEMLDLDADLEADLGIDSIKQVEIFGGILQSLPTPEGEKPDMEQLTGSRTLRRAVEALEVMLAPPALAGDATGDVRLPFESETEADTRIGRFLVRPASVSATSRVAGLADGVVLIIDDGIGIGAALAALLEQEGRRPVRVAAADIPDPREAGLETWVNRVVDEVHERNGPVSALVHLGTLCPGADQIDLDLDRWRLRLTADLMSLFLLSQRLQPDLERAASNGGAAVLGATALHGSFAVDPTIETFFAGHGAIVGFLKTLSQECPTTRVKAVDVVPGVAEEIAGYLLAELKADDGLIEVGYQEGRRTVLELAPAPDLSATSEGIFLPPGETVIMITGGARGITAEVAVALAQAYRPRLVLIGRTVPPSAPEPAHTTGLSDPRDLRQAIIAERRALSLPVTPALIEEAVRQLQREREVRESLARLEHTGVPVDYIACDVRDAVAFGAVIDEIYQRYGRIDGVIHGAGIIEDKLIRDKDPGSFERVVSTKVDSAVVLANRLHPESLRFLVFFSSVSGRFGNRGQGDYAAASEVLNKLAQWLDRRWPGRVVSINWGPWLKTGMVSPEVLRQFALRGVALIPPDVGCRRLMEELTGGRKGEVEVLIGGAQAPEAPNDNRTLTHQGSSSDLIGDPLIATPNGTGTAGDAAVTMSVLPEISPGAGLPLLTPSSLSRVNGRCEVQRLFDPNVDLYLRDHCIDGQPVVPLAMAMELLAETTGVGWPDLELVAISNLRLLRGITLGAEARAVRVVVGEASHGPDSSIAVDLAIMSEGDASIVHYRATAELRPRSRHPSARASDSLFPADDAVLDGAGQLPKTIPDIYRDWLFHGPLFQGIEQIEAIGARGARSIVRTSLPADCLKGERGGRWLVDPVMVDSALQMQLIWARLHWGITVLPTGIGGCELLAADPGTSPGQHGRTVHHEMRIRPENSEPLSHADHYFFDETGHLFLRLDNVYGAGSKALNRLARGEKL